MAIGSGVPYNSHTGNGVTRTFSFGFTLLDAADLVVTVGDVPTSAYTISGLGVAAGGSITFTSAPANGVTVLLRRVIALVRTTDYQDNGDLQADTLNADLDRAWMAMQQNSADIGQTLRVPELGQELPALPNAASRADKLLAFDSAGNPVATAPVGGSATDLAVTMLSTAGGNGDALIGVLRSFAGAVGRTLHDVNNDVATIRDFLPAGFNTTTGDATIYVQVALDSGVRVVDFLGLPLRCDQVAIPAGVWAKGVNWTKYTNAAGNLVLVNTASKISGHLTGTGYTGGVQRGIYPATSAVHDVVLDVEVSGFTHAVHVAPTTTASSGTWPKRWSGFIRVNGAVGTVGNSEGYGLLLETAHSCTFTVRAYNVRRHAVYLSAGACWNVVDMDCDGCGNYAAQINTASPQAASQYNTLTVRARNLTTDVAGQSGALAIAGRSHYNVCEVHCEGSAATYEAVRIEGGSSGVQADHPLGNKIVGGTITGQFTGADVIRMLNADSTIVRGNAIAAYGTATVIATRRTGTNLSTHGGYIEGNLIDCQGQAIKGIYDEINAVPSYVGPNEISNNAGATRVDDQSGGWRTGYSRRLTFSGTTASIGSAATGDTTVTFSLSREVATAGRRSAVYLTSGSGSFTVPNSVIRITAPSATTLAFRAYNAAGSAQTFDFEGWVEGD